jgi:DNA polymerase III subunit epsilon
VREIVLDTETTGLDARNGDRLIEIGCIELYNRIPTGSEYHCFINPQRDVPKEAEQVHGLSTEFLRDKPLFPAVADDFLSFIGEDVLVIHNASFDIGFLNAELGRISKPLLAMDRVVDTLQIARRKHPAGPNNLDALCKRYGIDNSKRIKHGALMDSLLLADVYVELLGERQAALLLASTDSEPSSDNRRRRRQAAKTRPKPLPPRLTEDDIKAHQTFVATFGETALWWNFIDRPAKPVASGDDR